MENSINGKDLKALFGTFISGDTGDFLAFPKRKDSLSNNFPEENGIEQDLNEPRFEARKFRLPCTLRGTNRTDFWSKHNGLFTELSGSGSHELYLKEYDKTFHVFYIEMTSAAKAGKISSDIPSMSFDLLFGETNPTDNIEKVYLVDDDDQFIIA